MQLSISMIGKYLDKYQPEFHITKDAMSISGVRFFTDDLSGFSTDYVYIGDAWEYFHDIRYKDSLLLASGQDQLICHGVDYEDFLNGVLSAFEFYNKVEQEIFLAANAHRTIAEMTEILGRIFHGAILVFDLNGNLLSSAHEEIISRDPLYISLKERNRMEADTLSRLFVDEDGNVSHDLTNEPKFLRQPELEGETIAMYLNSDGSRAGFVMMFPQDKMEIFTARHLEKYFAPFLVMAEEFTDASSQFLPKHNMLKNLLNGESLPEKSLKILEESVQMNGDGRILVYENQGIQNYTLYQMISRELQEIGANVNCEHQNALVILTSHTNLNRILECLNSRLSSGKCHIGISMPVQNVVQAGTAYRQAKFATERSAAYGVSFCEEYALEYLLENLKNQDMALELLHPALGILGHYDMQNQSDLLETLRVYVESGCSQIRSAEKLNIHLNTLKYRLKKIQEITKLDFSREKDNFYLQLSFRML